MFARPLRRNGASEWIGGDRRVGHSCNRTGASSSFSQPIYIIRTMSFEGFSAGNCPGSGTERIGRLEEHGPPGPAVWEMWLHRLDAGQNMSAKRSASVGKKVISRPNSGFEILGVRNVFFREAET